MNSTPDYTFSLQETTPFTRQFRVELVREGFDKRVETAIKKTAQRVQLNGFRKGKVPASVVKKMFGEQVRQEVVDAVFQEAFEIAVKEHELHVVSVEQVEVKDGDAGEITVHAALALMPKPEVTGYRSVAAEVALEEFTSTTVDEEIKSILESQATTEDVTDRSVVERGDVAIISFHMEHNGERVQGVGAEEQPVLVGDGRFLAEAEEQIIGMTIGEKKTFTVTMPKEFALEALREQPVDFVCEVKSISVFIVPELTDEYARELKLGETVAEMRAKLETGLKRVYDDRNRNRKLEAVLTEIEKNNPFEIPQVLIDEEIRSILVERKFINPKKTDPKKIDVTRFRDFLGSEAETRVRNFIILERIEEQEGFEASDEDVLSFFRSQFEDLNPESLKNFAENPQFLKNERVKAGARRHKVVTMLLEGASFTVVPATTK